MSTRKGKSESDKDLEKHRFNSLSTVLVAEIKQIKACFKYGSKVLFGIIFSTFDQLINKEVLSRMSCNSSEIHLIQSRNSMKFTFTTYK